MVGLRKRWSAAPESPADRCHSARNASTGSTRTERRAGSQGAASVIAATWNTIAAKVVGSVGSTHWRRLDNARVAVATRRLATSLRSRRRPLAAIEWNFARRAGTRGDYSAGSS